MLTDTDWQEMLTRLAALVSQAQKGYWAKQKERQDQKRDANEALEVSQMSIFNLHSSPVLLCTLTSKS